MTRKYLKIILILLPILLLILAAAIYEKSLAPALPNNEQKPSEKISQGLDYLKVNSEKCLANGEYRTPCLEDFFSKYLKISSAKEILNKLNLLSKNSSDMGAECHVVAHALGRQVLTAQGAADKAFAECSEECSGGCYHGVVEKFFLGADSDKKRDIHGVDTNDLKRKMKEVCSNSSSDISETGCWHGAGHGLMLILGYNLPQALSMCDVFNGIDEQAECYSGVFMENVVAAQKGKRVLKKTDLQFPCNAIAEKYKNECYSNQIIWWEENGLSAQDSINECKRAGRYIPICIESLGANLTDYTDTNFDEMAEVCSGLETDLKQRCIKGVVATLLESAATDVPKFCSTLKTEEDQKYCNSVPGVLEK